ncbi:AraC family transcriptional regulator [Hyphomicrobium sp.]|uniref:AraC family transcriptional regulator n=1 Tax=Hyphomicrobium sp. TaxID=82 RepID=UPI001D25E2FA|nr:AraC family transcriptional regulator [Hyphomicrobium sp.]MBY0561016.1 AraC family transcriptional regulator [Hyphomicrobium sp.]
MIAPDRIVAVHENSTLKASFWRSTVEESVQIGDPDFISIALNLGGGRVWRNSERVPTEAGEIAMQPFEGASWRFDRGVSFVHLYVPFALAGSVCESLFERELTLAQLRMSSATKDQDLVRTVSSIQAQLACFTPTTLLLDSWALLLAEILVCRLSSHAERRPRSSFGKLADRRLARVADYIEANIENDLDLASLADVAATSPSHFARRFKQTLGVNPHAYVLSRRLSRAELMLVSRDKSISQIAAACGFSSQSHFTTAFQSKAGVTPGAYRRDRQS